MTTSGGSAGGGTGRTGAILALVFASLFWAGNYTVGETAVKTVDPLSLGFIRWAPAAIVLVILAQLIERPRWRTVLRKLPWLALLGVLGMVGFGVGLYEGLQYTTAVSASLIGSAAPVLITVAAAIALRERPGWRAWLGLAVATAGVVLVISRGSLDALLALRFNVGDLWVIAATVSWTAYTVLSRRRIGLTPLTSTAVQAVVATVVIGLIVAFTGLHLPGDAATWGSVAFIVLFPSVGSYLLWNTALRRVPAAVAGISLNLIPVFTVLIALAIGHPVSLAQWIGGAVVLTGVLLVTLPRRRDVRPDAEPSTALRNP